MPGPGADLDSGDALGLEKEPRSGGLGWCRHANFPPEWEYEKIRKYGSKYPLGGSCGDTWALGTTI